MGAGGRRFESGHPDQLRVHAGVGDTSGQFAVVDSKYKYNLSNSLTAGTYNIWMTPSDDARRIPVTNSPTAAATFALK